MLHGPTVWDNVEPKNITLCSPDPQAFRPPEEKTNVLQVSLADEFQGGAVRIRRAHGDPASDAGRYRSDPL